MKLSKRTFEIFKNFAIINNSIFFDEPNVVKTMSIAGNIIAVADIEENIPSFGIYNFSEFLNTVALFDLENTEFEFEDKFVKIKCGRRSFKYIYTSMDLLPTYGKVKQSEKYRAFDKWNSTFKMSEEDINILKRSSSIMKLTHIDVKIKDSKGIIKVSDSDSTFSNTFKIKIEGEGDCEIAYNVENMIILPGNYNVNVCDGKLIKFMREDQKIFYFISPSV